MLTLLVAMWIGKSLMHGDHWQVVRTTQVVSDAPEASRIDSVVFDVTSATPDRYTVDDKVVNSSESHRFVFRMSGVLVSPEIIDDAVMARERRVLWTVLEQRPSLEWSRKWPTLGGLLEGEVSVKPARSELGQRVYSVTYRESGKSIGVGTVKVLQQAPIVDDLSISFSGISMGGRPKPVGVVISERIKELRLVKR